MEFAKELLLRRFFFCNGKILEITYMFRNMILAKSVLLYPYIPKFKNALTRKLRNVTDINS